MKVLKLSWMGLLALVCVVFFYACKKDVSSTSEREIQAASNSVSTARINEANFPTKLWLTGNCNSGIVINASSIPGVTSITVSLGAVIVQQENSNSLSVNVGSANIAREYMVHYIVGQGAGANRKTLYITVPACSGDQPPSDCASSLTAQGINGNDFIDGINCNNAQEGSYTAVYKLVICGNEGKLKLQGGLTNGATFISSSWDDVAKSLGAPNSTLKKEPGANNSGNTTVTVSGINLPAGTYYFSVTFNKSKSTKLGDFATGAWSAKNSVGTPIGYSPAVLDGEGNVITPEVTGYTERLRFGSLSCN